MKSKSKSSLFDGVKLVGLQASEFAKITEEVVRALDIVKDDNSKLKPRDNNGESTNTTTHDNEDYNNFRDLIDNLRNYVRQLLLLGKNVIDSSFEKLDIVEFASASTSMATAIVSLMESIESFVSEPQDKEAEKGSSTIICFNLTFFSI